MAEKPQNNPFHWLGLLRWSISQHSNDFKSDAKPMSEEDKRWLSECMDTMVRDDAQHMTEIIKNLGDLFLSSPDSNSDEDSKAPLVVLDPEKDEQGEILLEDLEDVVCQIDMARNFVKLKGLECLVELLRSNQIPPLTRAAAAGVMGTLAQNNPPVQEAMLQAGYLRLYSDLLQELDDMNIKIKCLSAMSSLIRSHAEAEISFSDSEGPQLLQLLMGQPNLRLKRKVLFLTIALLGTGLEPVPPQRLDQFWNLIQMAIVCLKTENDVELRENTIQMLINICQQGHQDRLRSTFGAQIDEAREIAQTKPAEVVSTDENAQKEIALWQEFMECYNSDSQPSLNDSNTSQSQQEVLMLEPQRPAGASPPP